MISIRTSVELARTLAGSLDPHLKTLLTLRRDQLLDEPDLDLRDIAHFIIAQPGDTVALIEREAGVPLEEGGGSNLEWVQLHHGGWLETVIILTDAGFGIALFVPDRTDTDPSLLGLLRAHL